jgi:acyl-CoA synthetase (AMP-forming)/AMP-acid ligase II
MQALPRMAMERRVLHMILFLAVLLVAAASVATARELASVEKALVADTESQPSTLQVTEEGKSVEDNNSEEKELAEDNDDDDGFNDEDKKTNHHSKPPKKTNHHSKPPKKTHHHKKGKYAADDSNSNDDTEDATP